MQHQLRKYLQQTPPGVCLPWSTFQQVDKMSLCIGGLWKVGFDQFFFSVWLKFFFYLKLSGVQSAKPLKLLDAIEKRSHRYYMQPALPQQIWAGAQVAAGLCQASLFWQWGELGGRNHLHLYTSECFTLVALIISLLPILTVVLFGLWSLV